MRSFFLGTLLIAFAFKLSAEPIRVLVTIPPIKFFVEAIGGDHVEVETLIPSGAGAHTYEPTPRQVQAASTATLWLTIGEPLEERVHAALPNLQVVDLRQGIDLLGSHCGHAGCATGTDPHFWLSPRAAKIFARTIADALINQREADRAAINARLQYLETKLDTLDQKLTKQLAPCKGKTILISHPALGYFCRDYHLHQLSIEFEGKEPSPKQLARVVKEARSAQVKNLILDTQYSAKGGRLVAQQLDLPICPFDPLSEEYFTNMHRLANCVCP